jgi:hypothetical protein
MVEAQNEFLQDFFKVDDGLQPKLQCSQCGSLWFVWCVGEKMRLILMFKDIVVKNVIGYLMI